MTLIDNNLAFVSDSILPVCCLQLKVPLQFPFSYLAGTFFTTKLIKGLSKYTVRSMFGNRAYKVKDIDGYIIGENDGH